MRRLRGKRILVTGAAGFIGANLVRELLRRNAAVHAFIRPQSNSWRLADILPRLALHQVDMNDSSNLSPMVKRIRPDIIFHLASPFGHPSSSRERINVLRTSVLGTAHLFEAAASLGFERFVHLGSSLEYGSQNSPLRESDRLDPHTPRGMAKAAATLLCRQFARANDRPVVILRPFSVYGYWEDPNRLVPTAIRAAITGAEMPLTSPGYYRDMIFVRDVVDACIQAVKADLEPGEIINVGSGKQYSNEEIVAAVGELCGREIRVRSGTYRPSPSDTAHWAADIRKARRLLGWEPRHTLKEGLRKTILWMKRHRNLYGAM